MYIRNNVAWNYAKPDGVPLTSCLDTYCASVPYLKRSIFGLTLCDLFVTEEEK